MGFLLVLIYIISLSAIFLYAVLQFSLSIKYLIHRNKKVASYALPDDLPFITIQLPIYNEKYVVERLLLNFTKLNYPTHKIEIQILDDSEDETSQIIIEMLPELRESGIDFQHLRRANRIGFKAGALNYGLNLAKGDFIAIFDADFVVNPEFLMETLCYFGNPKVGCVQTRWEHLNRNQNVLTKLQAFGLDGHFSIEQVGRNRSKHFINFNGTAGIWRKETIIDAGGWQHDTLTEDLDLSYRAQIKKWEFVYLEDVLAPAELPVAISAVKSQQFRWTKGGAENFVKNFMKIMFAPGIRFSDRLNGIGHLFNSSVYFFIFISALSSVPLMYYGVTNKAYSAYLDFTNIFFVSTIFFMFYYWVSFREKHRNLIVKIGFFISRFVQFLSVSLGLSYYNTSAVVQAYMGKKSAFIRTPKFNTGFGDKSWTKNAYLLKKLKFSTFVEAFLSVYFFLGVLMAFYYNMFGMLIFHSLLTIGFTTVFVYTIREARSPLV